MLLNKVFEASKQVSTKTLLLKHYYRRQGQCFVILMRLIAPKQWQNWAIFVIILATMVTCQKHASSQRHRCSGTWKALNVPMKQGGAKKQEIMAQNTFTSLPLLAKERNKQEIIRAQRIL